MRASPSTTVIPAKAGIQGRRVLQVDSRCEPSIVIPAKAGIHFWFGMRQRWMKWRWVPAFAGTTVVAERMVSPLARGLRFAVIGSASFAFGELLLVYSDKK